MEGGRERREDGVENEEERAENKGGGGKEINLTFQMKTIIKLIA